jgi:flagellar assembly factor FliW
MKIDIERLGLKNVQINPDTQFTFPNGMAGFENCKHFNLFHEEGGSGTVFWLQAVDDAEVMFSIVTPDAIDIAYEIELSDEDCALIGLKDVNDVAVAVIVYDDVKGGRIAASFRAPVVLNLKTRLGMQKILQDLQYRTS